MSLVYLLKVRLFPFHRNPHHHAASTTAQHGHTSRQTTTNIEGVPCSNTKRNHSRIENTSSMSRGVHLGPAHVQIVSDLRYHASPSIKTPRHGTSPAFPIRSAVLSWYCSLSKELLRFLVSEAKCSAQNGLDGDGVIPISTPGCCDGPGLSNCRLGFSIIRIVFLGEFR